MLNMLRFPDFPIFFIRVATHSRKSGKLGEFVIKENLRETQGNFKIKKFRGIFFSEFRMRFSKPSLNIC